MGHRHVIWTVPIALALVIIFLNPAPALAALSITVTGSWTQSIDKNNLTGGAGTNLTSTYTSAQNAVLVTILGSKNKSDKWQVTIKRINTTWNGALQISARRTSSGIGLGSISGGQSYIQVTTSDTTFFTGAGDRIAIGVQLQLSGASLQISPNQYVTTIQYTIIDTP